MVARSPLDACIAFLAGSSAPVAFRTGTERCKLDARLTLRFSLAFVAEITIAHELIRLLPLIATVPPLFLFLVELVIVGRCKALLNVVMGRVRSNGNLPVTICNNLDAIILTRRVAGPVVGFSTSSGAFILLGESEPVLGVVQTIALFI